MSLLGELNQIYGKKAFRFIGLIRFQEKIEASCTSKEIYDI